MLSTSTAPSGGRPGDRRSAWALSVYINDDYRPGGGEDCRGRPHTGLVGLQLYGRVMWRSGEVTRRVVRRTEAQSGVVVECCNGSTGCDGVCGGQDAVEGARKRA